MVSGSFLDLRPTHSMEIPGILKGIMGLIHEIWAVLDVYRRTV